ncbi:MAG: HEAT repeat domain-containing protein, partial [Planctomycetes bacterium]|nr:HEAT repeat domain-containing protein [Planctomycetota bacterium]
MRAITVAFVLGVLGSVGMQAFAWQLVEPEDRPEDPRERRIEVWRNDLRGGSKEARIKALTGLVAARAVTADELIGLLRDPYPGVAASAAEGLGILGEAGPQVLQALREHRKAQDPAMRQNVEWALQRMKGAPVEDKPSAASQPPAPLDESLSAMRSEILRLRMQRLSQTTHPDSKARLLSSLGSAREGEVNAQVVASLRDGNPYVQASAAEAAGMLKLEAARERLQQIALDPEANSWAQENARLALAQLDGRSFAASAASFLPEPSDVPSPARVEAWARDLKKGWQPEKQAMAAWFLGLYRQTAYRSEVERLLRADSRSVERTAAWAVGRFRDPASRPALEAYVREHSTDVGRWALHQVGGAETWSGIPEMGLPPLDTLPFSLRYALSELELRDSTPQERVKAIRRISRRWPEYLDLVAPKFLEHPDAPVRREMVLALGDRRKRGFREDVRKRLTDESPEVQKAAREALKRMDSRDVWGTGRRLVRGEAAGMAQFAAAHIAKESIIAGIERDPGRALDAALDLKEPVFLVSMAAFAGSMRGIDYGLNRLGLKAGPLTRAHFAKGAPRGAAVGSLARGFVPLSITMAAFDFALGRSPKQALLTTGAYAGTSVGIDVALALALKATPG